MFVAIGTRVAVTLAALCTVLLAACGGGDDSGMRATLTDDDCTYEGNTTPTAGVLTIEVENQTEFSGAFGLVSLAEGSTVDDLQQALDQYPRQFEKDGTLPEPPDFYQLVAKSRVDAGATWQLYADEPAGTYALVCFVDDDLPTEQIHIAKQLDVAE